MRADVGSSWRSVLFLALLASGCASATRVSTLKGEVVSRPPTLTRGTAAPALARGSTVQPVDAFERLLLAAGADDRAQWPLREPPLDREGATRLLGYLLNRPLPLRSFPQRMSACFLLREVLENGPASREELNRRVDRFRQVAVLRPDGYLASALTGRTQQRAGPGALEFKDGVFQASGFVLGQFYSGRSGVYRPVDAQIRPLDHSVPIAEVYDDADVPSRVMDGMEESFFALAMGVGKFFSQPVDSLVGLKDLPAGAAALIASSPEYLERFELMTTGEQIQTVSRLTTTLITMFAGGGAVANVTRGLGGMDVLGLSVSAQGTLALSRVVVPAGEVVTALAGGVGATIVLHQAAIPGQSAQPSPPQTGTVPVKPSQTAGPASILGRAFGRLGTVVQNPRLAIKGFLGSKTPGHALDQIVSRGVSPQVLQSTVASPAVVLRQGNGRYLLVSRQAAVVMTAEGQVVTAWTRKEFLPHILSLLEAAGVP